MANGNPGSFPVLKRPPGWCWRLDARTPILQPYGRACNPGRGRIPSTRTRELQAATAGMGRLAEVRPALRTATKLMRALSGQMYSGRTTSSGIVRQLFSALLPPPANWGRRDADVLDSTSCDIATQYPCSWANDS